MSRQTPLITPSSESPVWRSYQCLHHKRAAFRRKHSGKWCWDTQSALYIHHYSWEIWQKYLSLPPDYMWKVHSKHKISAGSLKLLICWFLAVNFRISQQSSWCQDKWDTVLSPGLLKQRTCWKKWRQWLLRTCTCTGELTAGNNLCKQKKVELKERNPKNVEVEGPYK